MPIEIAMYLLLNLVLLFFDTFHLRGHNMPDDLYSAGVFIQVIIITCATFPSSLSLLLLFFFILPL